jgi:hypothetical protein
MTHLPSILGGILGTAAMATSHLLWNRLAPVPPSLRQKRDRRAGIGPFHAQPSPRSHSRRFSAGEKLVESTSRTLVGQSPDPDTRERLSSLSHYAFGAAAGLLYSSLAKRHPVVTLGHGAAYGLAVWILAEELLMPALGLTQPPQDSPPEEHAYVAFGHLAYGLTLESTRQSLTPDK